MFQDNNKQSDGQSERECFVVLKEFILSPQDVMTQCKNEVNLGCAGPCEQEIIVLHRK